MRWSDENAGADYKDAEAAKDTQRSQKDIHKRVSSSFLRPLRILRDLCVRLSVFKLAKHRVLNPRHHEGRDLQHHQQRQR